MEDFVSELDVRVSRQMLNFSFAMSMPRIDKIIWIP
jgi:hypothetical protein